MISAGGWSTHWLLFLTSGEAKLSNGRARHQASTHCQLPALERVVLRRVIVPYVLPCGALWVMLLNHRRLFGFAFVTAHFSQLHGTGTKQILITISAMWAIEKLEHSRAELHLIDPNMCVYLDMMDCLTPVARKDLEAKCENMFFEDLERLVLQRYNSLIVTRASCSTHGCKCTAGKSRVHAAGNPCVDWSSAGKRLGGGGETVLVYFVWVAMRLAYQEGHAQDKK